MSTYTPTVEPLFTVKVTCNPPTPVGRLSGGDAMMIPITGGIVEGERVNGEVVPGGVDWATRMDNGAINIDAHYAIKTDDGVVIRVANGGSTVIDKESAKPPVMLTKPEFNAPEGAYDWLNHGVYVATISQDTSGEFAVIVAIFKLV